MIKEIFKYSISNLWDRRKRSFLTILSILIGISAIFALVSFGQGLNAYMDKMSQTMGTDKIMIMPKDYLTAMGESNVKLNDDDIQFLKKISGVDEATGMIMATGKIKFKDYKEIYPYVLGISADNKERKLVEEMFAGYGIKKGRALKKGDILKVDLGYNYLIPNKVFKKPVSVGDTIKINDVKVNVVGFYEEIGNPQDDINVYISLKGAKEIFGIENYFFILLRTVHDQDTSALAEKIKEKFRKHRGQKEGQEDFSVETYAEMMKTYGIIITVLNGILILIALISVAVAGVNIMNTMYTSILERIKEVGIMKALGAKNRFILLVFMIESGILGLFGGMLGIGLGYVFAKFGELAAAQAGIAMLKPVFPLWLIGGCLIFAFAMGSLAGLLPALQASRLKPVDALRYE